MPYNVVRLHSALVFPVPHRFFRLRTRFLPCLVVLVLRISFFYDSRKDEEKQACKVRFAHRRMIKSEFHELPLKVNNLKRMKRA